MAGDEGAPTKSPNHTPSTQEASSTPTAPAYPDWSSSMQAFYGAGASPPFFASSVAPATPPPFLWGGQHPLMPPYGTPVPYPAYYPHAGVYPHPHMVMTPGAVHGIGEVDRKATEGKYHASSKRRKGASGNQVLIGSKTRDGGKTASGSGNDVGNPSAESGSEGSSNDSDDTNNRESRKGRLDQMLADGANTQNINVPANFQTSVPGNPVVPMSATNLTIGMDLWNASPAGSGPMIPCPNPPGVSPTMAPSGTNDQWAQNERELKRQKRKQSNRESARRSRLRKQAECEELQHKVETLRNENSALRDELQRLAESCEKITSENNSIKEELTKLCDPDAVPNPENVESDPCLKAREDEGNC